MKKTSKLTSAAVLLVAGLVLLLCAGCAEDSSAVVAQGKVDNIRWALDDDGCLSFTGTGALPGVEYSLNIDTGLSDTVRPTWYDYRDQVEKVIVGANIDSVSMNAFMSFSLLRVLDISATVSSVDGYAVSGCPALERVIVRGAGTELERFCIGYVGGTPEDVMSGVTFEGVRGSDAERYAAACGADFESL